MKKNNTNPSTNKMDHQESDGMAYYDMGIFFFAPNTPVPHMTGSTRRHGIGQQMSDGTFEFIPKLRAKTRSRLIKKLAHGRLSETADGAIQLTLKVCKCEPVNICYTLWSECQEALSALEAKN